MDKVGNVPAENDPDTKANEAALGAAAPDTAISSVGNAFKFAVDTSGPTLASGETGVYLKNAGVTSGDKQESEGRQQQGVAASQLQPGDWHPRPWIHPPFQPPTSQSTARRPWTSR